jgi:hypothetical protein
MLLLPVAAQAQPVADDEPAALEIIYGFSFVDFDACGDVEAGRILRKLLREKVMACNYSSGAKEAFRANTAENIEAMLSAAMEASAEGRLGQFKRPPEVEQGMSCRDYRATPEYVEQRDRFIRYKRGEIGVDEALDLSDCPSGPASL